MLKKNYLLDEKELGVEILGYNFSPKLVTPQAILAAIPDGWRLCNGGVNAPAEYDMINNSKSFFSGERVTALIPHEVAQKARRSMQEG